MVIHSPTESFDNTRQSQPQFDNSHIASEQWAPSQSSERAVGGGPGAATADLPTAYASVFSHLRNGEAAVEQAGVRQALPEYYAAIQAADQVDQTAVNREAAQVMQALQNGNLDAQTRRQLEQEMLNLKALHEASGIARANLGLLLLRNGATDQGMQILQEAAQKDPQLADDPNYQKHYRSALRANALLRQSGTGGDGSTGNGADQGVGQTGNGAGDGSTGRVGDQTQQQQRVSPMIGGYTPYEAAQKLASQVTGPLDQQSLNQLADSFKQIIATADAGTSPHAAQAQQQWLAALQKEQTEYAPIKAQVHAVDQQIINALQQANLSPDALAQAKQDFARLGQASNLNEYRDFEQDLVKLVPGVAQMLNQRDQILGANFLKDMFATNQFKDNYEAEANQSATTRFQFARALSKAGDNTDAKAAMADALAHNTSADLQPLLVAEAQALGVTNADVQAAKQAMQQQGATDNSGTGAPGQAGRQPADNTGTGSTGGTGSDNSGAQQQQVNTDAIGTTQDPAMVALNKALDAFNKSGDAKKGLAATDAQFQQAVALADAELAALPSVDQLKAAFDKAFPAASQQKNDQLNAQLNDIVSKLPAADQTTWKNLKAGNIDQQTAQAFVAQHPDIKAILQQQAALTKDAQPIQDMEAKVIAAMDDRMLAHLKYAQALQMAGDARAKDVLNKGFAGLPQEMQQKYQQNPDVANLIKQIQAGGGGGGTDNTGLGTTNGGTQNGGDASTHPGGTGSDNQPVGSDNQRTTAGATAPPGMIMSADQVPVKPTGDAAVDKLIQSETYKELMRDAELNSKDADGLNKCKPYYKAACAVADAVDMNAVDQGLKQSLAVLANPSSSADDRVKAYQQALAATLQASSAGVLAHDQYAQKMMSFKQWGDADAQFDAAVKASDKIPVDLVQQLYKQMNKDINDKTLSADLRDGLNSQIQAVQQRLQMPIDIRKDAAQFNLAGGKDENGKPLGVEMMVGVSATNGQPLITKIDNHILNADKASQYVQQASDLTNKLNGVDIAKTPDLDKPLTALRNQVLINAPAELKKKLEHASHVWDNTASNVVSTIVGVGTAIGVAYLMSRGDEGAAGQFNALRTAVGGAAGLGTATLSNYGMEKGVFHRDDWSLGDSFKLGGGVYAATGLGLLATKAGLGYYTKGFDGLTTAETGLGVIAAKTGKLAEAPIINAATRVGAETLGTSGAETLAGAGRTLADAEQPFLPGLEALAGPADAVQGAIPGVESLANPAAADALGTTATEGGKAVVGIKDAGLMYTGADQKTQAGFDAALKVLGKKQVSTSTLDQAIDAAKALKNQQAIDAFTAAKKITGNGDIPLPRVASLLKGNGMKMPPAMEQLLAKYGAENKPLAEIIRNPEFQNLKNAEWVAANPDKAKALQAEQDLVNNMFGSTPTQRASAMYHLAPKELRGVQIVGDAQKSTLLSKVGNFVARPFTPLQAGRIPTFGEWSTRTLVAGTAGAGIYNMGSVYFNGQAAYDKGDTTTTPEQQLANEFNLFNDGHYNSSNIYQQSLLMGLALGSTKFAQPLLRSPMASYDAYRLAGSGIAKAALRSTGSAIWDLGRLAASANPAEGATLGQQLRQNTLKPLFFMTGYTATDGYSGMKTGTAPWKDALDNMNNHPQNEQGITHFAVINPKTGEIVDDGSGGNDNAADQQPASGSDNSQSQAKPNPQSQGDANAGQQQQQQQQQAAPASDGDGDGGLDPNIQGNIHE